MKFLSFLSFLLLSFLMASPVAQAQTLTDFKVHVRSHDAKFIGTAMGGALVTLTDRRTGDILVQGSTYGSTSGSADLMADTTPRHPQLVTDETAGFEFSLELVAPTPVTVTATAPLIEGQNAVSASKDLLLLPGKDYSGGNGIIIEVPGLVVDLVTPPVHRKINFDPDQTLSLVANVIKLCGCHIAKDSPWEPENFLVEAHIYKDSMPILSAPLTYSGEPGIFGGQLKMPGPGTYRIEVTAYDKTTKEAGMDTTSVVLTEAE